MGQATPIRVSVDVGGQPSSNVTVNYFLSNKDGIVVARGQAQPESPGQFNINLTSDMTSKLSPGPNQIRIFATSNEALRPDISSTTILAAPGALGSTQGTNLNNNQIGGNNSALDLAQ
jgi:hypothetical protein